MSENDNKVDLLATKVEGAAADVADAVESAVEKAEGAVEAAEAAFDGAVEKVAGALDGAAVENAPTEPEPAAVETTIPTGAPVETVQETEASAPESVAATKAPVAAEAPAVEEQPVEAAPAGASAWNPNEQAAGDYAPQEGESRTPPGIV